MLSPEQLQAMIAAEFLRVGASQQSWDQNFPKQPSVWVPSSSGPVLSDEYRSAMEDLSATAAIGGTAPVTELECPAGTIKEYVNGRWQCTAVGGVVADPERDALYGPPAAPVNPSVGSQPTGLPPFVNGRLGRVLYTPIRNRQLTGVRYGTLPQVVFGDETPSGYGTEGFDPAAGELGGGGTDVIQP